MKIFRIAAAVVVAAIGLALMAIAPALAADPFGTWLTEDKKGKIHIVNCGGALCGNLVWIQEPLDPETNKPKLDKHNVDASKQGRPLLGIPIVLNMKPSGTPEKWDGQVYNAEDGNTYSGSFTMTGANTAQLKGCVMGGLICKATDLDADELTPGRPPFSRRHLARWPNNTARTLGSCMSTAAAASTRMAKARFTAGRARIVSNQRCRFGKSARS